MELSSYVRCAKYTKYMQTFLTRELSSWLVESASFGWLILGLEGAGFSFLLKLISNDHRMCVVEPFLRNFASLSFILIHTTEGEGQEE